MFRPLVLAVALPAILAAQLAAQPDQKPDRVLRQKTKSFDTDPGWDRHNNRVTVEKPNPVAQDFGYGQTNHAGGQAAGEIGGRVQRCTTPATYGKQFDKPRTLDRKLRYSGTFAVTQTMGSSSLYFGWFNTKTMEVRPRNFLGLMLNGEGRGAAVHLSYTIAACQSDGFRATGTGPKGRPCGTST